MSDNGQRIAPLLKPARLKKAPKPLRSRTPLKASNPERKGESYASNYSGGVIDHDSFIRSLPCVVLSCRFASEAAHVRARGMGGRNSSWRELVPICARHHRTGSSPQEGRTEDFGKEHGVNLFALAEVLVVANADVPISEQLDAWRRLEAYPELERLGALQRGFDLTGHIIEPPRVAGESSHV